MEGQDWYRYGSGELRKATTVPVTTDQRGNIFADSTQMEHLQSHALIKGALDSRVQRSNKVVVGGVEMHGRSLVLSRLDPWYIDLQEDTGHALSVVWLRCPEGQRLAVVDGVIRWTGGTRPTIKGSWNNAGGSMDLHNWELLAYVFPLGAEKVKPNGPLSDRGQTLPLLQLPSGRCPLQVIPIDYLSRVVVLGRIRGSCSGVCAILEPSKYFLMVPKAAATFSMKKIAIKKRSLAGTFVSLTPNFNI